MPRGRRKEQNIVRRSLRLCTHRRTDLLEERIRLGEVDDAVDAHARGRESGASDGDGVARRDAQICGGLLGDEDAASRSGEIANRARKRRAVPIGQAEHEACSRGLRRAAGRGLKSGRLREAHRKGGYRSRAHGIEHGVGIGTGLQFDLPVNGDGLRGTLRHGRLRSGEERPDRREERDGDGDTRGGRAQAACAARHAAQPRHAEHEAPA